MKLLKKEREELGALVHKRRRSVALVLRARCVPLWIDGERRVHIRTNLGCNDGFASRWARSFEFEGLAGLVSVHPGRASRQPVAKLEA